MNYPRISPRTLAIFALTVLIAVGGVGQAGAVSQTDRAAQAASAPAPKAAVAAADPTTHTSDMRLDLVSRTYNAGPDTWTIVADATLSSNRICLPIVFNCIVSELSSPSNASLTDLECLSHGWNHLLVFRNHCLKQIFYAGHNQKFRFTYETDPGTTGEAILEVEFGRGFLPVEFQQLATAKLKVDLGIELDVTKDCPTEVDSDATLKCTITVANPVSAGGGPTINGITVTDKPDSALDGFLTGTALTHDGGAGTWVCSGTECISGELAEGESATFTFSGTVATTSTGGEGVNDVSATWTDPVPGGPVAATDAVIVVGNGDTRLELEKTTTQTEATPGGTISWTVTLTNAGPLAANNVVLTDTAPSSVTGMTLVYDSGVGKWDCSGLTCTTSTMDVGTATFTASGTLGADAPTDVAIVNEIGVTWENDILGPDFPITAGSAVPVVAGATTTSTTVATTVPSGSGETGAGLSFVG